MKKCNILRTKFSAFVTDSNKKEKKDKKDIGQFSQLGGLKI